MGEKVDLAELDRLAQAAREEGIENAGYCAPNGWPHKMKLMNACSPEVLATLVAVARAVRRRRAIVARLETIADQSAQQRAHAAAVIIREIDEATQALNAALAPVIDTATREDG